ncbi:hypothetical protein ACROYT_G003623 [Oculina patagonica]
MDGDSRRILVRRGLYYPNGLTLDEENNRLYWVDSLYDTLEYYDLERQTITTLLDSSSVLQHPFGLTLLDDNLYWTDWSRDAVYQADKKTASNIKVLVSGLRRPMDIHAYDRNKTLPDHPCSSSYGGCSHLCLLTPDGYHCSCPDHLNFGEVCSSSVVILPSSSTPTSRTSTSPTSIFNLSSSTVQRVTVSSTNEPPTPVSPTECRHNTCKNGGTCVVPGYFCKCQKYHVWNLCTVYVGSSAVEIELSFPNEKQWNEFDFKAAVAKGCTNFFCKNGHCKRRVKRSGRAKYFQVSDVKILDLSSGGENTWKIEFAVLFPSMDGHAPQPTPPDQLVGVVQENKESIEKAVGGIIMSVKIGKQPEQPKRNEKSTQDKVTSAVPIAAGVGGIVVVMIIVAALVIYRMRRNRRPNNTGDFQLENDWVTNTNSLTPFDNPTFNEDTTCDSISEATGNSLAEKIRQGNESGIQEPCLQNDTKNEITNKSPSDDSIGMCNPAHDVANSGDREIEYPEKTYASPQQQKKENPRKDEDHNMKPVDFQAEFPHSTATSHNDYVKTKCEDELHA